MADEPKVVTLGDELEAQDEVIELLSRAIACADQIVDDVKGQTAGPIEAYAILEIARRKLKAMIIQTGWENAVTDLEAIIDERVKFMLVQKGMRLSPGGSS
jgi:hypothetical protein